jgi:hypothetical protein
MRERMLAAVILAAACNPTGSKPDDRRRPAEGPAAAPAPSAPPAPAPTPPAVTQRTATAAGRESLADLGVQADVRVPAGAGLAWMDGSPELVDQKTATVRITHALDPDDPLFLRDRGLRVFVRSAVPGEATDLAAFDAFLEQETQRLAAEQAEGRRELDEADRELRAAGIELDEDVDELADELVDTPVRLEVAHRRATKTGWEAVYTFEEDGAYAVKVWRADLELFCLDVLATRDAALRVLDVCRTLARPRKDG